MTVSKDLAFDSIRSLGAKLRAREFTSRQLTEFFLGRLENIGRKLNAVVTITRDAALEQADRADHELAEGRDRGPLHGIPYGVKDLLATAGIVTSWGAAPLREQMIDGDATVIVRLREAGAVLAAKLAMVEIAGGLGYKQANASFTGPGINPWRADRWSGGSSSGPGSAVGGGSIPFAIGSETSGSIMNPACSCGITGFRPTYGRVSRHGAMALSWTMDKLGPMGRTADDCGIVLAAMAGADPADSTCVDRPYAYPGDPLPEPPFRLAVLKGSADRTQPEVRDNFARSLNVLETFSSIEEIELPDFPYGTISSLVVSSEMAAAFEGLVTSGDVWEMTAPEDRWGAYASMLIPAKDYINAMRIRAKAQRSLDDLFAPYDAVVAPTLATVAYPLDGLRRDYGRGFSRGSVGTASNIAGLPAITVPNGAGEDGLPTGLMMVGRAFNENHLLAVANRYQQATDWHTRHPDL